MVVSLLTRALLFLNSPMSWFAEIYWFGGVCKTGGAFAENTEGVYVLAGEHLTTCFGPRGAFNERFPATSCRQNVVYLRR